jgi:MraZ protein
MGISLNEGNAPLPGVAPPPAKKEVSSTDSKDRKPLPVGGPVPKVEPPPVFVGNSNAPAAPAKEKSPPLTVPPMPDSPAPRKVEKPAPPAQSAVKLSAPAFPRAPAGVPMMDSATEASSVEPKVGEGHSLPGEPPLAPSPGPVQMYQVRSSETLRDIARRTLGSGERWADIHKLNPMLKPELKLAAGTMLRLPGDACVQEDAESVRPLPSMRPRATTPKAKKLLPLTGTFPGNLDDNKAMTLPRSLREQLAGCSTVLVSPGPDKCLWLTTQCHLDRMAERLEHSSAREVDVRVFKRLYFAQTEKVTVDSEGRITLPERLAQFADLRQEVVLIGIDDHFEIWDAARWRQYTQQKSGVGATEAAEQE